MKIHQSQPHDFVGELQIVGCYLKWEGKILLMQLSHEKKEAGSWGVPAGKSEKNEPFEVAACRELLEETGISSDFYSRVDSIGRLYIQKPTIEYIFHLFHFYLKKQPEIRLSKEHQNYQWVSEAEIDKLPLVIGARQALQLFINACEK